MTDFENKIRKILKKEVDKPEEYELAIKNALNKKNKYNNNNINFFRITTTAACFIMCCSVVMATTYVVYEKIWKEPLKISVEEAEKEINEQEKIVKEKIREEEKKSFITENKAIEIANQKLNILGYDEQKFKEIKLIRDYESNIHYLLSTSNEVGEGILIHLNPQTGNLEYFCDNEIVKNEINTDDITENEAKEIANRIYKELKILDDTDTVEIVEIKKENNAINGKLINLWQVTYGEKYNNIVIPDTMFTTCFSVVNGEKYFYILKGKVDNNFNGNTIVISEEEAKNIAIQKENELSNIPILETNAELAIEKMNVFIYYLENNINDDNIYKTDDISRLVWKVEIKHDKDKKYTSNDLETIKKYYNKKYYIDATTGEIIGGEQAELFQ